MSNQKEASENTFVLSLKADEHNFKKAGAEDPVLWGNLLSFKNLVLKHDSLLIIGFT
jgi:hypothetical protein